MAPQTLTDYERRRLENIRRNGEMISSLLLRTKASDLLQTRKPKPKPKPKPDRKSPTAAPRRSGRVHPPADPSQTPISAAFRGHDGWDSKFLKSIRTAGTTGGSSPAKVAEERSGSFDPRSELDVEDMQKVVMHWIHSVRFLPVQDRKVVIVGDTNGILGFWDADDDVVYEYKPHLGLISGISVHPFSVSKIFTSSYDGSIRLMDIEKGAFNTLCSSKCLFFSICQSPNAINSLYIGEGPGRLKVWDEREGKSSSEWDLHADRINTVDISPQNVNLMATSSSDGMACIWDLRTVRKARPRSIKSVPHNSAVLSSYFSPSGSCLATTCPDVKIGILSGANFSNLSMIPYRNHGYRDLAPLRAIWGWDDSYLFIGSTKKAVDVISTIDETTTTLENPSLIMKPRSFAAHPYKLGSLAGGGTGGKVTLWTKE